MLSASANNYSFTSDPVDDFQQIGSFLSSFIDGTHQSGATSIDGLVDVTHSLFDSREDGISINATAIGDAGALAADLAAIGMTDLSVYGGSVVGILPYTSILALSKLDNLFAAAPNTIPVRSVGLANSQGDEAQRTDVIRSFQRDLAGANVTDLTGAGITVGVVSGSYDNGGIGSAATDVASGDLPGVGNPLGSVTPVNVLNDNVADVDEGRAMLQIVHDIAPRANLAFANVANGAGVQSEAAFAANILALRNNASADVIVDDLLFFTEPMFMDGFVAQAVNTVVDDGAIYVSAAGNFSNDSYQATFQNGALTTINLVGGGAWTGTLHDFGGGDTAQRVTVPPGNFTISLQWDEPFGTVAPASGGATTNIDLFVGAAGATTFFRGTQVVGTDPVELLQLNNPGGAPLAIDVRIGSIGAVPTGRQLKYVIASNGAAAQITEFATNSSTLFGHANSAGAIAAGASAYYNTPEFDPAAPYVAPALNNFSALGGTNILFDPAGNRLADPEIRDGVDVVGPDGVNTTFFGADIAQDADALPNFFGTSAAAPHVASLAALLIQANPLLGPEGVESALDELKGTGVKSGIGDHLLGAGDDGAWSRRQPRITRIRNC